MIARRSSFKRFGVLVAASIQVFGCAWVAAQEATFPTPKIVIYPGDIIHEDMIVGLTSGEVVSADGQHMESRSAIIGKAARRTLLPGQVISSSDVGSPRLVVNGAEVSLHYEEDGLTIVALGSAQQDGFEGDVIRVRNTDSGVVVSGVVQADGSVRLGGG